VRRTSTRITYRQTVKNYLGGYSTWKEEHEKRKVTPNRCQRNHGGV
jgi:hypothetical protein